MVQFSRSVMFNSMTPWTEACQASLSITSSWSLLKLMSIESVMPSNHLILCLPLFLLPSIFPSIRVFTSGGQSIEASASASFLQNGYSRLISFRVDWFDFLVMQGTSRVFSNTTAQKHQFFSAHHSLWSNSHIIHDLWKKHSFDYMDLCW